ncbi:MAG: hypothetical protein U5K30_15285 [Acidimicrobiales bacterium]|nr:hypothetical protein [Acidimicrobiales bacterium]
MSKYSTRGGIAVLFAALLFAGGMVSAGAIGGDGDTESDDGVTAAALGPDVPESSYTSVTPCRVFDTRGVGGAFENETRDFDVVGDLAPQGGKNGGCDIPAHADSVVMTVTGVTPTGKGFMRGKAYDGSSVLPQATLLNYAPAIDASNTITLPVASGATDAFTLGTYGNRVHLVGDVVGYYSEPFSAVVDYRVNGSLFDRESRFDTVTETETGVFSLTVDSGLDPRGCAIHATIGVSDDTDAADSGFSAIVSDVTANSIEVTTTDSSGTLASEDFMVHAHC